MKKLLVLVATVAFASISAFAELTDYSNSISWGTVSNSSVAVTASVFFENEGVAQFSFLLKDVNGDAAASAITWDVDKAFNIASTEKWVYANQYAVVAATITKNKGHVYIYQDNKNSTSFKAHKPRFNENNKKIFSGLVRSTDSDHFNVDKDYMPMLMSVSSSVVTASDLSSEAYKFTGTERYAYGGKGTATSVPFTDRWFVDKSNDDFDKKTQTMLAQAGGPVVQYSETDGNYGFDDAVNNTVYMYFCAGFKNIVGGERYGTDKIIVDQSVE